MLLPVIMAGGTGSRLWPMSRELYPKQFLKFNSDLSMLQDTLVRLQGLSINDPMLICNEQHRFLAAEQLRQMDMLPNTIILEPFGRNTAPAIALAAFRAVSEEENPFLLILAADHVIEDVKAFHSAVEKALALAQSGKLVTFGIVPTHPETGYGYIQRGENISSHAFKVQRFVEKPDTQTAIDYVSSGNYYWNSGMFLFSAKRYLEELNLFRPDIYDVCSKSMAKVEIDKAQDFIRIDSGIFSKCPDESIDYAVMENTQDAVVVPLDAGWNDVGSWSALWDVNDHDKYGNALNGDIFTYNTSNCYINSENSLVAAIGVENLVIVNTKDAVLVIDKSKVQDVKKIVEHLKSKDRREYRLHRESYRPWGKQDKVVDQPRYQINRVTVKPGGKFSLHKHIHRAEHWVVLAGTAQVTLEGETFLLTENQSTFIPIGAVHMLENPGKINLELLEIYSGSYLGEDDIFRFKDYYDHF